VSASQTGIKEGDFFGRGELGGALPGVALGGPCFTPGYSTSALRAGRREEKRKAQKLKSQMGKRVRPDGRKRRVRRRVVNLAQADSPELAKGSARGVRVELGGGGKISKLKIANRKLEKAVAPLGGWRGVPRVALDDSLHPPPPRLESVSPLGWKARGKTQSSKSQIANGEGSAS